MPTVNILGAKMVLRILRAPRFKKPYTVALPPPWSKYRDYLAGLSEAQRKVTDTFAELGRATRHLALADRMKIIGDAMRGVSFGGRKRVRYPRLSPEELERRIEAARRIVGGGVAAVAMAR